ncbi:MAG: hypothetical protein Q9195_007037 [Heterodermia aff. obscurata]
MSGRRSDSMSGISSAHHSQSNPGHRSMAIQDLLNPSMEDRGNYPQYPSGASTLSGAQSSRTGTRTSQHSRTSPARTARYEVTSAPQKDDYSRTSSLQPPSERSGSLRPPHVQRRRTPSVSSTRVSRTRREFRPTYSDEETLFIWYHRLDLGWDWNLITEAFNKQFPERPRGGAGGIQCKYYRCTADNNIPKVRERRRSASAADEYGMKAKTRLHYPWMRD